MKETERIKDLLFLGKHKDFTFPNIVASVLVSAYCWYQFFTRCFWVRHDYETVPYDVLGIAVECKRCKKFRC